MFDQLKYLMHNGERYIVVEGGKPEYVFMSFEDYAALAKNKTDNPGHAGAQAKNPGAWERGNSELDEFGIRAQSVSSDFTAEPVQMSADPTAIRLEDLPL